MSLDLSWPVLKANCWCSGCFCDSCSRGLSTILGKGPAKSVQDQSPHKSKAVEHGKAGFWVVGSRIPHRWITPFFISDLTADGLKLEITGWDKLSEENEDRHLAQLLPAEGSNWIDSNVHCGLAVTAGRETLLIMIHQPSCPCSHAAKALVREAMAKGRVSSHNASDIGKGKKGLGNPLLNGALKNKRKEGAVLGVRVGD